MNYHHGETNLRMADCVIINKIETADSSGIQIVRENIAKINPDALVIQAASPMSVEQSELLRDKKCS